MKQCASARLITSVAFFKNKLQKITNMVRPGRYPLTQLANRIMEKRSIPSVNQPLNDRSRELPFQIIKEHQRPLTPFVSVIGRLRISKQIESIVYRKIRLSINSPNNCVILETGKPVVIENFIQTNNNQIMVIGREFKSNDSLFEYPLDSRRLGISCSNNYSKLQYWPIKDIKRKAIKIPIPRNIVSLIQKYAIIDLLHCETEMCELF